MSYFDLTGKNILVTGASSGLGRQIAIDCAQMGAKVILMGRDKQRLHETLAGISHPKTHLCVSVDLIDFEKIEPTIDEIVNKMGKINGVVHCAGISLTLPLRSTSPEKLMNHFNVNVIAAYQLTRVVTHPKHFSQDGGSIIFISSIMGMVGENAKSAYSLTKGALIAGARSLAVELAVKKIRVNCISPGLIITPINMNAEYIVDKEKRKALESHYLLGLGSSEDISGACIYLLSNASKWVTGINLVVDGGYTSK